MHLTRCPGVHRAAASAAATQRVHRDDGGVPTSHRGQRLTPPVALIELGISLDHAIGSLHMLTARDVATAWWLVYILPSQCDTACRLTQNIMVEVTQNNGSVTEHQPAVKRLILLPDTHTNAASIVASQTDATHYAPARRTAINFALSNAIKEQNLSDAGHLYLMNPSGQILLFYAAAMNEEEAIKRADDVRSDLARLR